MGRKRKKQPEARIEDGMGPTILCTEHVRSNLGYGIGVLVSGIIAIALLLFPLFSTSGWLLAIRWIGIPIVAAFIVMSVIQILNYCNRSLEVGDGGIRYTDCLRRQHRYTWDEVVAYDIREKSHALELVLAGHPRTFHTSSTNFDEMLDVVSSHTELIALSDR